MGNALIRAAGVALVAGSASVNGERLPSDERRHSLENTGKAGGTLSSR